VSVLSRKEFAVSERPSLGFSALSKTEFSTSRFDKLRRIGLLFVAAVLVGAVFYYLTRAVQTSTAHATGDQGFHYEQ
jgi:predicted permease